jgi:hypothetical protein
MSGPRWCEYREASGVSRVELLVVLGHLHEQRCGLEARAVGVGELVQVVAVLAGAHAATTCLKSVLLAPRNVPIHRTNSTACALVIGMKKKAECACNPRDQKRSKEYTQ